MGSAHMSHCRIYYDVMFLVYRCTHSFFSCYIFKYDYVVYIIKTSRSK